MLSLHDIIALHLADLTFPQHHPLAGRRGLVFAFAVRHRNGVVLVDTGVGSGHPGLDSSYRPVRRPLVAALGEQGLRADDVCLLINTHLHFDHCGGNRLFPRIPICVQAAEYEAARRPRYTIPEWVDFPGARYRQLSGEAEIVPGVKVLPTPGHTPGHQSVVVDTAEGHVVIAGQAIYSVAEYEHIRETGEIPPGDPPPDPDEYLASARRLIGLRSRRVLFSHDASTWDRRD
jgi:N-acyl homoserine lactone hydrolase